VTAADRINFGLGYTRAVYTSYINQAGNDWSGKPLDKAPKFTANLGYSHQFALNSGASVTAYVGERFSTGYDLSNPATGARFNQTAYHKTDAHVTYASADDKWNVQAYVRNIEDRNVATSYQRSASTDAFFLAEPRIVGVRANVKF
jgi:iron complex outermembrane receptor protein